MDQCEVWVGVDETACLNEQRPIRLRLVDTEWAENGGYHGVGGRVTVLELKIRLFPLKKLQVRNEHGLSLGIFILNRL